jgi:hypothetical protein
MRGALRKKPQKAERVAVALGDEVIKEDLPYPFVHYPMLGGTFIGFSRTATEMPALCACTMSAVSNYIRLNPASGRGENSHPLRMAPLDSRHFPSSIAQDSLGHDADPVQHIHFEEGICHRCQMKTPSLRYCHPMYGGQFVQVYGWYVGQTRFRFGVGNGAFLDDVCPPEIQELFRRVHSVTEECQSLARLGAWRSTAPSEQQAELERLRKDRSSLSRQIGNVFQNETRRDFGVRGIGEGWVSESILYQIVARQFPDHECLRHFRPTWLGGLELDVFVREENIAFEYQGQQHFYSVEHWGGQAALDALRIRDARKAVLCQRRGLLLIAFDFTEPLTEQHVRERMRLGRDQTAR